MPLSLLLDEDTQARRLLTLLREAGHDVRTVSEVGLTDQNDATVFAYARREGRLVLTRSWRCSRCRKSVTLSREQGRERRVVRSMKTLPRPRRRSQVTVVALLDTQLQDWQQLVSAMRPQQLNKDISTGLFIFSCLFSVTGIMQLAFWLCRFKGTYYHPILWFLIATPVTVVVFRRANRTTQQYLHTLQQLAIYRDARLVGPLVEQLSRTQPYYFDTIARMLINLLLRLKPDDAGLLNKRQRLCLYDLLAYPASSVRFACDEALAVAVLKALEQIGSDEAIYPVERAASIHKSWKVRAAARECLPFLQARAEQRQLNRTLLRPVDKNETRPTDLLCPATAVSETPAGELLRANMADASQ